MNNYYIERNEKYWQQTAKCLGLDHCHLLGIPYEGQGLIAIIEISLKTSEQEIGLLGVVTALGIFKIYSVPMKNNEELKNNSKIKNIEAQVFAKPPVLTVNFSTLLNKEQSLINCFDWVYSKENDIIAAGDQVLNNIIKYRAEDYLL